MLCNVVAERLLNFKVSLEDHTTNDTISLCTLVETGPSFRRELYCMYTFQGAISVYRGLICVFTG